MGEAYSDCCLAFKSIADFLRTVGFLFLLGSYSVQVIPREVSRSCIIVSIIGAFLQYFSPGTPHCLIYLCMLILREQISMNVKNNLLIHKAWPLYGSNNHYFQPDKSRFSTQMHLYKVLFFLHASVTEPLNLMRSFAIIV